MFKIIYEFIHARQFNQDTLLLNIKKSEDSLNAWSLVKSKLNTDRPIKFLQQRYQKLVKSQDLNQKELSLLSVQYNKLPIEKFMIIFPGKSFKTISNLIKKFEAKSIEKDIKESKLDQHIKNSSQSSEF